MHPAEPTLTTRQLNRAVLARQLLLTKVDLGIPTALERTGGLQTQYAPSGYIGLWGRLAEFERDALTWALDDRSVVQATLMRCTIHMVSAADFWPICAAIRASRREWWLRIAKSRKLPEVDHDRLAEVLREALADGPRRSSEVIATMQRAGFDKPYWEGAGLWVDMVRVPPSGTWARRRADLYGLAEQWIPRVDVVEIDGLRLLLTRYLQAFGPAALADAATWSGVPRTRLEQVVATMKLATYRDETGTALPEPFRTAIFHTKIPQSVGTVLVDGSVAATWAWRADHVEVDELATLTVRQRREVSHEVERLTAFYRD